jgi:hypothetical protein
VSDEIVKMLSEITIFVSANAASQDSEPELSLEFPAHVSLSIDHEALDGFFNAYRMTLEEVAIRAALSAGEEYMVMDPESEKAQPHRGVFLTAAAFSRAAEQLRSLGNLLEASEYPQETFLSFAHGYETHFRKMISCLQDTPTDL